ncbi:hypothetical protein ACQPZP_04355 [Spirillospora sp. CA-142024]|uniref:hypothetical protein n=1 Tax=Spirillospora sp. CA-142024 TaxID=3240036 RepID=UPI003D8C6064
MLYRLNRSVLEEESGVADVATTQKKPARKGAARERDESQEGPTTAGAGVSLPVPVVTPHVKVYKVHVPGTGRAARASRATASHLPSRERLVFYGGLGAAAAFGAISWPVAAAVGIGTEIARRGRTPAADDSE